MKIDKNIANLIAELEYKMAVNAIIPIHIMAILVKKDVSFGIQYIHLKKSTTNM